MIYRAIEHLRKLSIQHLQDADVDLIYRCTKFLDAYTLEVARQSIIAEKILIAVGGEAVKPKIPGIE